jgi:hypothetical protein
VGIGSCGWAGLVFVGCENLACEGIFFASSKGEVGEEELEKGEFCIKAFREWFMS